MGLLLQWKDFIKQEHPIWPKMCYWRKLLDPVASGLFTMRTTLDIQDEVLTLCQQKARERGISLDQMVNEAIWFALQRNATRPDRRSIVQEFEYDLPISGTGGLQPGVSLDCTADLLDAMDGNR